MTAKKPGMGCGEERTSLPRAALLAVAPSPPPPLSPALLYEVLVVTLAWVWHLAGLWGQLAPQLPIGRSSWSSYSAAGRVSGAMVSYGADQIASPQNKHQCGWLWETVVFWGLSRFAAEKTFSGGISLERGLRTQL